MWNNEKSFSNSTFNGKITIVEAGDKAIYEAIF